METPNLKDAELCSFYGVMDPTEVPGLMFTIGEKNLVMDAVSEINDVKMASELKNAAQNFEREETGRQKQAILILSPLESSRKTLRNGH